MTQKIKFKINGMHCASCAILIEDDLKSKPGIIQAKINSDSKKAVVIYDKAKIKKSDIYETIQKTGEYQVEELAEEIKEKYSENRITEQNFAPANKIYLYLGFLISFSFISLLLNVFLGISALQSKNANANSQNNLAQNQNLPSDPSAKQPAVKQNFDITKADHIRGSFDAPVTLVEFSDFECPFCAKFAPTLDKILSDYKGKVRLVYKYYPLSFHPNAQKAAEAAECASEQGKFWEYHDKLFANLDNGFSVDNFKQWAGDLDLNTAKFNKCLDSDKYADKVQADSQEGSEKGVSGTPATFVNGELVSGALPYASFKQVIDKLLEQ